MAVLSGRLAILATACVLAGSLGMSLRADAPTRATVKASLLYNFASFSEWPDAASTGPLVIGVTGDDEVARALQSLQVQPVNGRAVEIRTIDESEDPRRTQVLYISGLNDRSVAAMLARTLGAPVLTVGDHARFTTLGGIIRLYEEQGHMRFEVDVARAHAAKLKISSRVLTLARIVHADGPEK